MPEVAWFLFIVASLVLIATPGQDMILVMSRSIAQGPAAGVATAAGVSVGLIGHTVLATLGLGAIVANPKIAVFYFAFLPQFVLPGATHPTLVIFVLGLVFAALTFLVKGPVGLGAGLLSSWLRSRPQVLTWIHRTSGAVLLGLGIRLALERRP